MSERKMSAFGTKLKRMREGKGLTQGQLAERAGMHKFGIAKLEQGTREPSWETVQSLAKALETDCTAFATEGQGEESADVTVSRPGRPRKASADAQAPSKPAKGKKGKRRA